MTNILRESGALAEGGPRTRLDVATMFHRAATTRRCTFHTADAYYISAATRLMEKTMSNKYRVERWIVVMLLMLFVLPFVGTAEEFYVERLAAKKANPPAQSAPSLPENGVENAIDGEPE